MPASKLKNIHGLLGKPVASSTPIKGLFDTNIQQFSTAKKKTIRNDRLPYAVYDKCANIPTCNVIQSQLEIMSSESDSDSDVMPSKNAKLISPTVNLFLAKSSIKNAGQKKNLGNHLECKKVENDTTGEDFLGEEIPKKKSKPLKRLKTSSENLAQSSKVIINSHEANEPIINPPNDYESSSDESGRDSRDHEECNYIKGRKPLVKKNNLSQKNKLVSMSPEKHISRKSIVNLSTNSQKHIKVSEDSSKNIATPVTGMPPACQRQSLSRTMSRISASASNKFMVEIPRSLAESFSASLQLIKRRIDFECIDKPEEQRINAGKVAESTVKRNAFERLDKSKEQETRDGGRDEFKGNKKQKKALKSLPDTDTAPFSRNITALKPVYSAEKNTTGNESNAALIGVRRSGRNRIPPISYWVGNDSQEQNQLFVQNQVKKNCNALTSLAPYSPKQNKNLKKHSSLRASTTRDDIGQANKTEPRKSVHWKDVSRNKLKDTDVENQMKVCCSMFGQSVFLPADDEDDGEESGVQYAESLHAYDMQSEFIRLLSGAKTANLLSRNSNQLYTVLENTVSLHAEGVPKQFGLHSQFYVHKGVSHKLLNNSSEASLLLQVIIK